MNREGTCTPCGEGEISKEEKCVCDSGRYFARADDGTCTACTSDVLEFDPLFGRCLCVDGGALSVVEGIPTCGFPCESGALDATDPEHCADVCPQTMVLHRSGNRLFCEECADYLYYDASEQESSCVSYERCRLDMRMEPRIVYEGGQAYRVCATQPGGVSLKVDGEWLPGVGQAITYAGYNGVSYYVVRIGSDVFWSNVSFEAASEVSSREQWVKNIISLVVIGGTPFVLTAAGEIKVGEEPIFPPDFRAVYLDGAYNFLSMILNSGEFLCDS